METLLSLGFWISIPFAGLIVLKTLFSSLLLSLQEKNRSARIVISVVIGLACWSIPLLVLLLLGLFNGSFIGLFGWMITIFSLFFMKDTLKMIYLNKSKEKFGKLDVLFILLFIVLAFFYLGFPHESIFGGRDQGIYSNSAVYIEENGSLKVDYPVFDETDFKTFMPGLYKTENTITVQFSHLFTVLLAMALGTAGVYGLFGLNALFGLLAVLLFRILLSQFLSQKVYVIAGALYFGFNVTQIWNSRITMTEIFTQVLILGAFIMLVWGFKEDNPKWAGWSGFFFGLAVLCRIDSLLLMPLLIFSGILFSIFKDSLGDIGKVQNKVWLGMYSIFIPLSIISFGYYYYTTQPYYLDLFPRLLPIIWLSLILTILTPFSSYFKKIRERTYLYIYYIVSVVIVLVFIYAHVGRPDLVNYTTISGTYREFSIINLSYYLSVPIVYLGLFGWLIVLRKIMIQKETKWIIGFTIVGGFSALYLYNINISPDQYWASRRFVPVVIPGFIWFSFVALEAVGGYLREKRYLRRTLSISLCLFLVGHTVYNLYPIALYKEQGNVWANIKSIADSIPDDALLVTSGADMSRYSTPLFMSFSKNVIPIGSLKDSAITKLNNMVNENEEAKVLLLSRNEENPFIGLNTNLIATFDLKTTQTEKIAIGLPRAIQEIDDTLYLFEVTDSQDLTLEAYTVQGINEQGFYITEKDPHGNPFRWTESHASVEIPGIYLKNPTQLAISLAHTGPDGRELIVKANDQIVYTGQTLRDTRTLIISLDDVNIEQDHLVIEIITEPWSPVDSGATDSRQLGVAVGKIQVLNR
ncbi:ArnT family glycosyltransferase [Paenibacillus abyssi]|uniref:Glycosyltransferase RgtA/B/C/D-like domain-containing protein n=1 Tax=Paenibacillus abyssi TaxID=1340531 RepID=A0A917CLY5_9BACL|nr:hypothetical protein [Paenibacillus abyssi]GGF92287.1 hypothetical protein GCM10010916_07090 [Paenibacillus abyssi]